jgi:RNA polymerase sigma factor (sigma-70 family)
MAPVDPELEALLAEVRAGSPAAWERFVERYERLVYSVPRRMGFDEADSADIAQATWVLVHRYLEHLREPGALVAWLATTARREASRFGRGQGRRRDLELSSGERGEQRSPADPTEARSRATLDGLLAELGRLLIEPVAGRLADSERLLVLPYGGLHGLPFHAFGHAGSPLGAAFEVAYAPALALVAARRAQGRRGGTGVLAVSSDEAALPALVEEAAALRAIHGPALVELELPELEARLAAGDEPAAALHLAAHGAFQPHNPVFSGLSFGDRVLTAHDVRRLALDLELVSLGGCETGRSRRLEGEELIGIDQAFLAAGTRAVVSSLWVVDDAIAARTMAALHRELAAGRPVGEALARVQRELLAAGEHPFDWAPFVVTGDAGARLGIQSDPHQGPRGE